MEAPWAYGDPTSYEIGAAWLAGCALIEDWGCGTGWLRTVTEAIACHPEVGVPDIAFRLADLTDRFPPDVTYTLHQIPSATQYGGETIRLLERPSGRR